MPKIDGAHKNYLTPEIWEETHLREIFCDTLTFQHFPWSCCKICVQKEVIHDLKNHSLVTWQATNLLISRKWCGFVKLNHYYFVLRYHPLTVLWRQYTSHFQNNDVTCLFDPLGGQWPIISIINHQWIRNCLYHLHKSTETTSLCRDSERRNSTERYRE